MKLEELYILFLKNPKICTDTRKVEQGSIFFALKGENFNGNQYAQDAIENGSAYAVIDEKENKISDKFIVVDDALKTLQALATYHRSQLSIPVIGLTGSNGKTTTKELIHAVLSQKYNCLATKGNLNNHIGVPLTILGIRAEHEIAIIEMGANHVEEIEFLCNISQPDYGLITNIGKAHIGEFGGFDMIVKAKMELYNHIIENKGKLFVNGSDELLMARSHGQMRFTYGSERSFDTIGEVHSQDPFMNVEWNGKSIIRTKLVGKYNLPNILAAISIGKYFNVSAENISSALEDYIPSNNRSQILETENNLLIMDAYNANPSSVEVAIDNLVAMRGKKKFFILGDMLELGDESEKEHLNILNILKEFKLQGVLVGPEFASIYRETDGVVSYNSTKEALAHLPGMNLKDNIILVKGSRGMKLETLCPVI